MMVYMEPHELYTHLSFPDSHGKHWSYNSGWEHAIILDLVMQQRIKALV